MCKVVNLADKREEKRRKNLSAYEELPIKEIASIMNRSEGAVEQLLQRAKMNLKKKIKHP